MSEQFCNDPATTLNGAITASVTAPASRAELIAHASHIVSGFLPGQIASVDPALDGAFDPTGRTTGDSGEAERTFRREAERHSGMIPNTIGA